MAHSRRQGSSRTRGRNRRNRNKGGAFHKFLMGTAIVAIPVATLGAGGYLAYHHLNKEVADANGCYSRPDQHQTAVFVDFSFTGDTSGSQQRDLQNTLTQAYAEMPANGAMSIFTTQNNSTATVNTPDFVICKPARNASEQERIGAPALSAPVLSRLNSEAQSRFEGYLRNMLARSRQTGNQAINSPILEQLQGISRFNLGSPISKLIVYSDGINNSPAGQFCVKKGELPRFATFAKRPGYAFVRPNSFNGADVEFLLVEFGAMPTAQLPFCTTQELREFWVDYAKANDAGSVNLTPLSYGAGR